jgi:hypothetical protein
LADCYTENGLISLDGKMFHEPVFVGDEVSLYAA